jgi:endonuclease/exonuclease/phosphatase family metal-dependent hydrolase
VDVMNPVSVASFNVENLFARPTAFTAETRALGDEVLAQYSEFNTLISHPVYSPGDKERMRQLLVELDVYYKNGHGAARRRFTQTPKWSWLRKNRGSFDTEPADPHRDVEIVASGRDDWIGWLELVTEPVNEIGTRMTAQVIRDVDADIIAVIEAEDRPSLVRFNHDLLDGLYRHVMLVDGNDERGIDVGIMTKAGFPIRAIRSNVDAVDASGTIFSRDCCQYEIETPSGAVLQVLVNHFKSQSGGGGGKRRRQATEVRRIVDQLIAGEEHVIVLGDLNEGQPAEDQPPPNLGALFEPGGPLGSCFALPGFETGQRLGTYNSAGIRDRLDYILISASLESAFAGGEVFRKGVWGSRSTRPTNWETYPEMTASVHQASDHAAIVVRLDLPAS